LPIAELASTAVTTLLYRIDAHALKGMNNCWLKAAISFRAETSPTRCTAAESHARH